MGSPFRNTYEMIAFLRGQKWKSTIPKTIPTVVRHPYPYGRKEHHGSEKPVSLLVKLLGWTAGDAVLDPFLGSGSTAVAAQRLGIRATGIEIEERYCEIAARRCSQEVLALEGTA
ncbi:hypothetical protein LCGC14_2592970 [marine sediment metagenome]|uniref:DNA methylase N-4/N-6 domain-containing protein n=1 Tax=marine sediment metagenome TaxID=412755 RepID=A0A0F9AZ30_9ZZZZ